VLSYARAIWALFTVDQTLESFLRGHVEAFQTWPGVPRTLVYDYVARHIIIVMCPPEICGAGASDSVKLAADPPSTAT
jgi:hypothetical protein